MNSQPIKQSLRKFWVVTELADCLRVRPRWVYDNIRSSSPDPIPCLKLGKYIRFNPESPEFQAWLERHSMAGIDNHE
jgi:hypothetical protein